MPLVAIDWLDQLSLNALEREWNALAAGHSPFVGHAWITSWYRAFGRGRGRVWAAREHGSIVALLPLLERRGSFVSPTNAHSPSFQPIGDPTAVESILRFLISHDPVALTLNDVPAAEPALASFQELSAAAHRTTWVEPGRRSPIVETSEDYGAYLAGRGRHVRRELARQRRKLEAEHRVIVETFARPNDAAAEVAEFLTLEASGWKRRRGTAILQSKKLTAFYRDVCAAWAAADQLRISSIRVDGTLVAADLCVISNKRAWIPKGAYDERFARYSPGRLLLLAEIESAFDSGLEAVELLGDADPYKLAFATGERRLCTAHSFGWRALPSARIGYRRNLRPRLRQIYKSIRS